MNEDDRATSKESRQDLFFTALNEFRALMKSGRQPDPHVFSRNYPTIERELFATLLHFVGDSTLLELTLDKRDIDQTLGPAPPLHALRQLAGLKLGNYMLLQKLGEGAMGIVYAAEEIVLKKRVAIKITKTCTLTELASMRLKQEATIVASLQHDHIVPVFGFEESHGYAFYVMQLIEGSSLNEFRDQPSQLIKRLNASEQAKTKTTGETTSADDTQDGKRSPNSKNYHPVQVADGIARIGYELAQALNYAHLRGVQHLDVKPSNVLLDIHGKIWLTDFGLAEIHQNQSTEKSWAGTVGYMSPETLGLAANGRLGTSDIYSLGATLYCLITGKPPFMGGLDEYREWMLHGNVTSLRRIAPGIPEDLETIILKAMDRDASLRYQSAKEMAIDLQCYLQRRPITSRPIRLYDATRKAVYRNRQTLMMIAAAAFMAMASFSYISWLYLKRAQLSESHYSALVTDLFRDLDENGNLRKNADPVAQYQRLKQITEFLETRYQQKILTHREHFLLAQLQYYTAKQLSELRSNEEEVGHRLDRSISLFQEHYSYSRDPLHLLDSARSMLLKAERQLTNLDMGAIETTRLAVSMVEQLNRDHPNDPRFLDAIACYSRVLADAHMATYDHESAYRALDRSVAVSRELQKLFPKRWWYYSFNECMAEQSRLAYQHMNGEFEKTIESSIVNSARIDSVITAMKNANETNNSMTISWLATCGLRVESMIQLNQNQEALTEIDVWLRRHKEYLAELPGTLQSIDFALGMLLSKIKLMQQLNFSTNVIEQEIAAFEALLPEDIQIRTRFMLYHPHATTEDFEKSLQLLEQSDESEGLHTYRYTTQLIALLQLDRIDEALKLRQAAEENKLVTPRFYKILLALKSGKQSEAFQELSNTLRNAKASSFEERFCLGLVEKEMKKIGLVLKED